MRDYGRVASTMWTRGSGKRLRGKAVAQVVASYLLSCGSSSMIGLYHVTIGTIAHETGHSETAVRGALEECEAAGFAFYDEEAELVWVPNVARIELGEGLRMGDKRRVSIDRALQAIGDHPFVAQFLARYGTPFGVQPVASSAMLSRMAQSNGSPFDAPSMGHPAPESGRGGPFEGSTDPAHSSGSCTSTSTSTSTKALRADVCGVVGESDPVPGRVTTPDGTALLAAWESGVRRALGGRFAPTCTGDKAVAWVSRGLAAHGPPYPSRWVEWLDSQGERFARDADIRRYPREAFGFVRWLNEQADSSPPPRRATRPRPSTPEEAPASLAALGDILASGQAMLAAVIPRGSFDPPSKSNGHSTASAGSPRNDTSSPAVTHVPQLPTAEELEARKAEALRQVRALAVAEGETPK